jgi:hypothetical protein
MAQSLFEDISVASAVDAIAMTANIANMHKYGIILTIRVQPPTLKLRRAKGFRACPPRAGSKVQTRAHAEHGDFSSVYLLP